MSSEKAIAAAGTVGARAGQGFLDTGIWPRCPFRGEPVADLADAWTAALFAVVGPVIGPAQAAARAARGSGV